MYLIKYICCHFGVIWLVCIFGLIESKDGLTDPVPKFKPFGHFNFIDVYQVMRLWLISSILIVMSKLTVGWP